MPADFSGLEVLQKRLSDIQQNAQELNGEHVISASELFPTDFMRKHTNVSTIEEFLKSLGISGGSDADFDKVPVEKLDSLVNARSNFSSWKEFKSAAVREYAEKQLFRSR